MEQTQPSTEEPSLCIHHDNPDFFELLRGARSGFSFTHFTFDDENNSRCLVCRLTVKDARDRIPKASQEDCAFNCAVTRHGRPAGHFLRRGINSECHSLRYTLQPMGISSQKAGAAEVNGLLDFVMPVHLLKRGGIAQLRRPLLGKFEPDMLRHWISACDYQHQHVIQDRTDEQLTRLRGQGRFRLLDVISGIVVTIHKPCRYFALSYVWGRAASAYYTSQPVAGIQDSWEHVPQTIRDAAGLVKNLGEQYLWVDGLCIIQSDAQDKELNIAAMSAIFSRSYLTIVAANGVDAHTGLRRLHQDPSADEAAGNSICKDNDRYYFLQPRPLLKDLIGDSKWNRRAWTYQEDVLSARRVFFTDSEVYFICAQEEFREAYHLMDIATASEASSSFVPSRTSTGKIRDLQYRFDHSTDLRFSHYYEFVEDFSKREITHAGDRLDAFQAIIDYFRNERVVGEQAVAESGIPLRLMNKALLWHRDASGLAERIPRDARNSRQLPSWSWVGWEGPVTWDSPNAVSRSKSPFKFTVVDENNIVASDRGLDENCSPWPFEPELCRDESRGSVTIHLWGTIFNFRLNDSGNIIPVHALAESKVGRLGFVESGTELVQKNSPERQYTALYLMGLDQFPRFVMLDRDGDYWRRLPYKISIARGAEWKKYSFLDYVRLR